MSTESAALHAVIEDDTEEARRIIATIQWRPTDEQ